jgi:uroporphyrin-3 C-methyltransferase
MSESQDSGAANQSRPAGSNAAAAMRASPTWGRQSNASASPRKPATAQSGMVSKILIFLLLLAVGALGFYTWEQDKAITVLFNEYNALNEQSNALATQTAAGIATMAESRQALETMLQNELQLARTTLSAQTAQLDALNRELVATRMRITDSGAGGSQVWMLAEAESLMRFARQRLLLARDVRSAIGLLVAADDLLRQLNDPAAFTVREALATDLATLQGVREVDITGLYAQLGALAERVLALEIGTSPALPRFVMPEPATLAEDAGWLDRMKNRLDQYFVISRTDVTPVPTVTAEQAWVIRQSQALKLEQARLALLRGEQETWQVVLDSAITGIRENLDGEEMETLLASLATLRDTAILTNIPPASNGLNAVRQILPRAVIESGSTEP